MSLVALESQARELAAALEGAWGDDGQVRAVVGTSHTFYGVEYRYLSRSDYHLYLSNETCRAKSWTFDDDNYLVGYDSDGDKLFITAVVGHTGNISTKIDDSFTGTILQNDNVTGFRFRHLGGDREGGL